MCHWWLTIIIEYGAWITKELGDEWLLSRDAGLGDGHHDGQSCGVSTFWALIQVVCWRVIPCSEEVFLTFGKKSVY